MGCVSCRAILLWVGSMEMGLDSLGVICGVSILEGESRSAEDAGPLPGAGGCPPRSFLLFCSLPKEQVKLWTKTMLRTLTITRYVTPLREGGSLPAIVDELIDDGRERTAFPQWS